MRREHPRSAFDTFDVPVVTVGFDYDSLAAAEWARFEFGFGFHFMRVLLSLMPNKSPEPTAVGAVSSAIAVHAVSRRWLSFFR